MFIVIPLLILVTGCGAVNPRINLDDVIVANDRATEVFFRPKTLVGSSLDFDIIANGTLIGEVENGEFVTRQLIPGEYKFHSKNWGAVIDRVTTMQLEPSLTYFVKVYLAYGFFASSVYFQPVAPEIALIGRD